MSNPINIDLRNDDLNPAITEQDENIVMILGGNRIKITKEQYIEFNKENGEFVKHLPFEVPAIR